MQKCLELTNANKVKLNKEYGHQILTIPFEKFVLEPLQYINKIANLVGTEITSTTQKVMKKQKVPRKRISESIPLSIYKRCGWEAPDKSISEEKELVKRRQFAVESGASKDSLDILDQLCAEYEKKYFSFKGI